MQTASSARSLRSATRSTLTFTSSDAARLSIRAIITYHVLLFALIFLRPDLDPYWHTLSEYAVGDRGWIMSAAFITAAVSYAALFIAIRSEVRGIVGRIGLGILLICTVGLTGVGIFTTDPMTTAPDALTTTGTLHLICGFSQLALLPFAALCINLSLAFRARATKSPRTALLATGALPLAGLIGFATHYTLYVAPLGENPYGPGVPLGWPARVLFLTYALWLITLARHAARRASE